MQYIQQRAQDQGTFRRLYINSYTQKLPGGSDVRFTLDLGQDFAFQEIALDSATLENKFVNFYQSQKIDFRALDIIVSYQIGVEPTTDYYYEIRVDRFVDKPNFISYLNAKISQAAGDPDRPKPTVVVAEFQPYSYDTYTLNLDFTSEDILYGALVQIQLVGGGWEKLGIRRAVYPINSPSLVRVFGQSIYDFTSPPVILVNLDPIFGPGSISNAFGTHSFALQNTSSFGDKIFFTNTQRSTCNSIYSVGARQTVRYLEVTLLSCDQMPLETPVNFDGVMNQNDLEMTLVLSLR